MCIQVSLGTVLLLAHSVVLSSCDSNVSTQNKSKRGIYDLGDGTGYNVLPAQHIGTYTQVRALSPDETPYVDLTYKPVEQAARAESVYADTHGDNVYNGQTFYPQQQLLHAYNPNAYNPNARIPQQLNFQNNAREQQVNAAQHHNAHLYPLTFHPKLGNPLPIYGADKQFNNPAGDVRPSHEINLPQYTNTYSTIPIIYGQSHANLNPSKYVQHGALPQYNHALSVPTLHQPLQRYINPQHSKLPATINYAHTLNRQRPSQNQQSHHSPSPMSQITQNFKSIQPNFFQPQVFENPIVPQLQHYIPRVQNPFDAFTRPVKPYSPIQTKPEDPELLKTKDKEADPDTDGEIQHKVKEEIQGEVIHEEIDDEDQFEKGYDDAARGFPAHGDKDDEDDYRKGRYQNHNDDSNGRYESHKSSRYTSHDDHDDDDHEDYHGDSAYRRPHEYDDDRIGRHYSDHDHEGSQHHHSKHEPRKAERDAPPRPSKSHRHYKKGETDHLSSERPTQSGKYYKSTTSILRKPASDTRHASSAPRTRVKTNPHNKLPARSSQEGELSPPKYQYGFEPIKSPYSRESKIVEDTEARHSSPISKKKIYKENWQLTKTSVS